MLQYQSLYVKCLEQAAFFAKTISTHFPDGNESKKGNSFFSIFSNKPNSSVSITEKRYIETALFLCTRVQRYYYEREQQSTEKWQQIETDMDNGLSSLYKGFNHHVIKIDEKSFYDKANYWKEINMRTFEHYEVLTDFSYYFIDKPMSPLVENKSILEYYDHVAFLSKDALIRTQINTYINEVVKKFNILYNTNLKDNIWRGVFI